MWVGDARWQMKVLKGLLRERRGGDEEEDGVGDEWESRDNNLCRGG